MLMRILLIDTNIGGIRGLLALKTGPETVALTMGIIPIVFDFAFGMRL